MSTKQPHSPTDGPDDEQLETMERLREEYGEDSDVGRICDLVLQSFREDTSE